MVAKIAEGERQVSELVAAQARAHEQNVSLSQRIQEQDKRFDEILQAKHEEAANFKEGITKMFKFKDQVREKFEENKRLMDATTADNEKLRDQLQQKQAFIE